MVLDRRKWFTPGVAHNQEHGRNTGRSLRNQYIGSSGGNGDKHAPRPAKANMSGEIAHEEILPIASTWHLVLDQSGSMAGYPSQMQLRAAVLFMEVLSKFEEEAEKLGAPLDIQSELRAFGTPRTPTTLYKKIDDKLTMRKRVAIFQGASGAYGGTNDYDSLAEIVAQINQRMAKDAKYRDELANGARREFVVVLTDGGSGDPVAVNMQLQTLIDMGVKIVGVGMGASGKPVLTTYNVGKIAGKKGSSEAQVCYNIGSLPNIIAQMLEADIRSLDTL